MSLRELRQAHKLTQQRVAKKLGIGQEGVPKLEKRTDLLLSTLREYVEAILAVRAPVAHLAPPLPLRDARHRRSPVERIPRFRATILRFKG